MKVMAAEDAFENIIDLHFPGWNTKKVLAHGKSFDDLFQIDGVPLWWFYRRFITPHVLPKQFSLQQHFAAKEISFLSQMIQASTSWGLRKYFSLNEKMKMILAKSAQTTLSTGKKVLFLTYTTHYDQKTGNTYRLQKIVDLLQEEQRALPLVLYTEPLTKRASLGSRTFAQTLYGYITSGDKKRAKQAAQQFFREWKQLDKTLLFGEKWLSLQATLNFFFSKEFLFFTFLSYFISQRVMLQQKIGAVILTSRNGLFEKCMIAAAQSQDISVFILQHGLGLGLFSPDTPSGVKHLVFGEAFTEKLLAFGVRKEDIVVTGTPLFDEMVPYLQKKEETASKKDRIVLITAPFVEEHRMSKELYFQRISKLLEILREFSSEVIIKMHPRERMRSGYEELLISMNCQKEPTTIDKILSLRSEVASQQQPAACSPCWARVGSFDHTFSNQRVLTETPPVTHWRKKHISGVRIVDAVGGKYLYPLLQDAALVINFCSTVALEAMILDRPVLTLDPLVGFSHLLKERPYSAGVCARIDGDVKSAVREALQDSLALQKKRKEVVKKMCYRVDGKVGERVVQAIYGSLRSP